MDTEIHPLVVALNRTGFLQTLSCCAGHPDEELPGFQYAVANVIFAVKDEPQDLFRLYRLVEELYRLRRTMRPSHDFSFDFSKRFLLGEENALTWDWVLRVEGSGKGPEACRTALNAAFAFLTENIERVGGSHGE